VDKTVRAVTHLLDIMVTLRSPGGCPWDAEQTPETLQPYLLEETYEVLEAIDRQDPSAICEELGDLLLQIVFQARIFEERGDFDLGDVAEAIADKLERRHPHVFAGQEVADEAALLAQWEEIKRKEKLSRGENATPLAGVPPHLPALMRARKLTEKASRIGFDWNRGEEALAKLDQDLEAFREALRQQDQQSMTDELGDVLFAAANLGRFLKIDAEDALRRSVNRFIRQLENIESLSRAKDDPGETPDREWEVPWPETRSRTDEHPGEG
jgi:MazG family protein